MEEIAFSHYLLGRLSTLEDRLRAERQPPAAAEPAPVAPFDPATPPEDYAARSRWYSDNLERLAGPTKPPAAKAAPEQPPKTLSRAHPRFAHEFAKHAAAIASGTCEVVE